MMDALEAVKLEMLREELVVSALCFSLREAITLVPATVGEELNVAAPITLNVEFNAAALSM